MKYGNRSLWKRTISSPFTLLGVLILFVILVKATWNVHQKALTSSNRLNETQAELSRLQAHQKDIATHISYLSTDQGIEAELRTKYRAVKPGESVAVIVDKDQVASVQSTNASAVSEKVSWWTSFLRFFGLSR
jgi:cell division protein FtsB